MSVICSSSPRKQIQTLKPKMPKDWEREGHLKTQGKKAIYKAEREGQGETNTAETSI